MQWIFFSLLFSNVGNAEKNEIIENKTFEPPALFSRSRRQGAKKSGSFCSFKPYNFAFDFTLRLVQGFQYFFAQF
jgi:hypothetical protein